MQNRPPLREDFGTPGWVNWLSQVFLCLPWKKALNVTSTLDFLTVAAYSQSAATVTVEGARPGDAVIVTPYSDTVGIAYKAVVSANDQVSVYAVNFSAGSVNPDSMQFRIIVIQN